jgi:hypothetical protein
VGRTEWGENIYSMPISEEVAEFANEAMDFIDNGDSLSILLWDANGFRSMFYISFDKEENGIILTHSGASM